MTPPTHSGVAIQPTDMEEPDMMIRPIRSEADYDEALGEIDRLMGVALGTPESDKLEILVTLVERYESEHWVIEAPDPIAA